MRTKFRSLFTSETGATLVEYALIVSLVTVFALVAVAVIGNYANKTLNAVSTSTR